MVLITDAEIMVAKRDPNALARPANVHDFTIERHLLDECFTGFGRSGSFQDSVEDEWPCCNFQFHDVALVRFDCLLICLAAAFRYCPWPLVPTRTPFSTTGFPATIVVIGQPVISIPS